MTNLKIEICDLLIEINGLQKQLQQKVEEYNKKCDELIKGGDNNGKDEA